MKTKEITVWGIVFRILELFHPFRKAIAFAFVMTIVVEAIHFIAPYFLGRIVDGMVQGYPIEYSYYLLTVSFCAYGLLAVAWYVHWMYEVRNLDPFIDKYISCKTLHKVFGLSPGQHKNQNSGISISAINDGENAVKNGMAIAVYEFVPCALKVCISIIALFWLNVYFGTIALVGVGIMIGYGIWLNHRAMPGIEQNRNLNHESDAYRMEVLRHLPLVYAHVAQRQALTTHQQKQTEVVENTLAVWVPYIFHNVFRNAISPLTKCVLLVMAVHFVYQGHLTIGTLIIGSVWMNMAMNGVMRLAYMQRNLLLFYANIKRYLALHVAESDLAACKHPVIPKEIRGDILFRNVHFTYPDKEYIPAKEKDKKETNEEKKSHAVLQGVDFSIRAGERVGIVGATGAGKSTIVSLLLREYDPSSGEVLIDGIPLSNLDGYTYHDAIGYVEQSVGLFDDTLHNNICFGLNGKADLLTKEDLEHVVAQSRISDFGDRLTDGLETQIGENGLRLSGGERQRVGIARALIRNPRLLIFDEATSSLDSLTEKGVVEAIDLASKGRTTIVIAHRLSTLRNVDRIIVLEKGRVVGEGTHAELCKTCPTYRELAELQMSV